MFSFISFLFFSTSFSQPDSIAPQTIWKFKTNAPVIAPAVVNGNIAYVGSTDSSLYA